jgi:uncharacterized protein YceK
VSLLASLWFSDHKNGYFGALSLLDFPLEALFDVVL